MMKNLVRDEKGGALVLALILLLVGGLISAGLLGHMGAGLLAGEVYNRRTAEIYAADAGVEDGLWQIQKEKLADIFSESDVEYYEYDYSTSWDYNLTNHDYQGGVAEIVDVNDKYVNVTIENVWIPMGIPAPDKETARQIIEEGKLIISGSPSVSEASTYEIKIRYNPCGGIPAVKTIGIWLPPGFEYEDNCNLDGLGYDFEVDVTPHKGGYAIVWSFSPSVSLEGFPSSFTFQYEGPEGQIPGAALSWIDTTWAGSVPGYTWDADVKIYKVVSTATDPADTGSQTTVESYSSKVEMRKLSSTLAGDYHAIGNTLMLNKIPDNGGPKNDTLLNESSSYIDDIPSDARVEAAYLYWVGWFYENDTELEPVDTTATFKINGKQVYFQDGEPMEGAQEITGSGQWLVNESSYMTGTYYYATKADVTGLVQEFSENGTGNGVYTVGDVEATADAPGGSEIAYAGWSLIVIYSSLETHGHQLYLYDNFITSGQKKDVDWNGDGESGGTLSGFLVPEPGKDEEIAAKITAFVGEGDSYYSGDYLQLNGENLWDGITCKGNTQSSPENVWNGKSRIMTGEGYGEDMNFEGEGIDIDTLYIRWDDELLQPGDISAKIDMHTETDIWQLVYIILSFRSETTSGGIMGYTIR